MMLKMMGTSDTALRLMLCVVCASCLWSCGSTKYSGSILNTQRPALPAQAGDSVKVLYHFAGGTETRPGRVAINWRDDTLGTFQITQKQLKTIIYPAKISRQDGLTVSYERRYESELIVHWYSRGEEVDSSQSFPVEYDRLARMDCNDMRRYAPDVPEGNHVTFEKAHIILKGSNRILLDGSARKIDLLLGPEPARTPYKCLTERLCPPSKPDTLR